MQAVNRFRKNLQAVLDHRGISQRLLAENAETSYPNINRILKGKTEPGLEISDRIASAVGLQLWQLLLDPITFGKKILAEKSNAA